MVLLCKMLNYIFAKKDLAYSVWSASFARGLALQHKNFNLLKVFAANLAKSLHYRVLTSIFVQPLTFIWYLAMTSSLDKCAITWLVMPFAARKRKSFQPSQVSNRMWSSGWTSYLCSGWQSNISSPEGETSRNTPTGIPVFRVAMARSSATCAKEKRHDVSLFWMTRI